MVEGEREREILIGFLHSVNAKVLALLAERDFDWVFAFGECLKC
jgi:hypothetical protein